MAHLTITGYRPGAGALHAMDVRFKMAALLVLALTVVAARPPSLALLTAALFLMLHPLGIGLVSLAVELRYFFVLLLVVMAARALAVPGPDLAPWLPLSAPGLREGATVAWRMLLVVLLGVLLTVTTRAAEIKAAVEWYLAPVPGIPRARIGTMLGLMLRFIPLVFAQARQTLDAQRARAVDNRKNPLYRLSRFGVPFVRRTFETADRLALAMEARAYSETRTAPEFRARGRDAAIFLACLGIGAAMMVF